MADNVQVDKGIGKGLLTEKLDELKQLANENQRDALDREMTTEELKQMSDDQKNQWGMIEFRLIWDARRLAEKAVIKELNENGIFEEGLDAYQGYFGELIRDTKNEIRKMQVKYFPEKFSEENLED